jgi:hypothetical protein
LEGGWKQEVDMKSGRRVEEGGRKYEDWRESGRRRKKG